MKKGLPFLLLFCYAISWMNAQESLGFERLSKFTAASITYTQFSANSFESDLFKGTVKSAELKATLQFPIEIEKSGLTIINGINFIRLNPKLEETVNSISINRKFYGIAYNFGLVKAIGTKNWKVMTFLKPTLASDFNESFSNEDFIFQASGFTTKRVNEFWEFGFGVSLNTRFGNRQLLPLLHYLRKKGSWETNIFLPSHIQQFYCFKKSKVGVSVGLEGNNYNFGNTVISNLDLDKLSYSRVIIGPIYEQQLAGDIYVNLKAGTTAFNKQEWNDENNEIALGLNPENKLFFRIALKLMK